MYRDMRVAVVVPAHNEELLVGTVVATAPEFVDHVIVVDDASTDGTSEAAEAVGDPRTEVHRLPENQGVGGAIVHGHKRALELGCDVSVVMAGDAQMDPAYLPAAARPDRRRRGPVHQGQPLLRRGLLRGDAAPPRRRQHRDVLPDQGGLGLLGPLRPAERLHRDPPLGARAAPARPARQALRVRERPADQAQRAARPGRDVPIPAVYGTEVSGLKVGRVAPRLLAMLWRGFWHRMWWKYVLQSFSAVALMFFTGLFLVAIGIGFSIFTIVNTLGPARRQPRHRPARGRAPAQRAALPGLRDAARHPGRQSMSQQVDVDAGRAAGEPTTPPTVAARGPPAPAGCAGCSPSGSW